VRRAVKVDDDDDVLVAERSEWCSSFTVTMLGAELCPEAGLGEDEAASSLGHTAAKSLLHLDLTGATPCWKVSAE